MIDHYIKRHNDYLALIINESAIPADTIRQAMKYSLFPGGKRIRPVLVYLVGELLELNLHVVDVIAAAVELTHCYSLIHDDLPAMDNDDFRRGKPSCHKAFDEATAILVGDDMQALAIEVLLTKLGPFLQPQQIVNMSTELVKASGISGMVSGQSLDLSDLAKPSITEHELRTIHLLKTGKLISACIEMVLSAKNDVSEQDQSALRTFANHLGLVFQIQDDYLDHFAPKESLGKNRSSDQANQKTTYATLFNKTDLEQKIAEHYQIALDALHLFNLKAVNLIDFTTTLKER